jgi:Rrf2 family protein
VNIGKSARYALYAALTMAEARGRLVTVGEVARRYDVPEAALAKVVQQLVRARVANGTRGVGGGYRLARRAAEVSVLDVIDLFEPRRGSSACVLAAGPGAPCAMPPSCALHRLFAEVDEVARCTFASVTLETLAGGERGGPLPGPAPAPLAKLGRRARPRGRASSA